jgi:hypothetical protein
MDSERPFGHTRIALGMIAAMLALGFATSAHSASRMYTGSLVIVSFGNDTTDGGTPPFSTSYYVGIPLTGKCNTAPYHSKETLTFPTRPGMGADTIMFTIPAYGGQVPAVDTNTDTVPDVPVGCTSVSLGDPLTGSGAINTTGSAGSSRPTSNPRGFTLPQSELNKVKAGEASFNQYGVYLWEVHFADLHNEAAVFAKNGGDGAFAITHAGVEGTRKVVQTAGKNKFGGVMQLLGSYGDNEGYLYDNQTTSVFYFNWLFNYLGHGGQATSGGVVTKGYQQTSVAYGYTRASGYVATSTVYAEVFKWTTGTVKVTALQGTFPTILERKGYDSRTGMGSGVVQLVSPMLTHWVGAGESSTAGIGIMNITFAPEPSTSLMLGGGVALLGLLFHARRRSRR